MNRDTKSRVHSRQHPPQHQTDYHLRNDLEHGFLNSEVTFSGDECPKEQICDPTRRTMLRGMGFGTLAALGGLAFPGCGASGKLNAPPDSNPGAVAGVARDIDILNFALNLEYLEAEFYTYATTGQGIEALGIPVTGQNGNGTPTGFGTTTGGARVSFDNPILAAVIAQVAQDEQQHVVNLRNTISALGGTPAARPDINLAALTAQGVDISTINGFLMASRAFEDTGVSAYGGAARFISNSDILRAAARILAAEGYHAANIRVQIAQRGVTSPALDPMDVPPPPTGTLYFAVDSTNALAIIRTPRQVLNIVLGLPASDTTTTRGGFFPTGVNANLATLTTLA